MDSSGFGLLFVWAAFYVADGLAAHLNPLGGILASPLLLFGLTALTLGFQGVWRQAVRLFRWPGGAAVAGGAAAGAGLWLLADVAVYLERLALRQIQANNPLLLEPGLFRSPLHLAALVVAVVFLAPVAEELFYRGLIFGWLRQRLPLSAAVVASGLAFGLAHLIPTLAAPLAVLGCGLAYLYYRSGSLWPSIAAHAAVNALSLLLAYAGLH